MRKRLHNFTRKIEPYIIRFSVALIFSMTVAMVLIPALIIRRGQVAYGGEYLCIALIFYIIFKLMKAFVD